MPLNHTTRAKRLPAAYASHQNDDLLRINLAETLLLFLVLKLFSNAADLTTSLRTDIVVFRLHNSITLHTQNFTGTPPIFYTYIC